MEDPVPDIAKLAEAQGAVGIGPVTSVADAKAAISKGVAVLKSGGVCVIDFHIEPPADRSDGIGHPPDGGLRQSIVGIARRCVVDARRQSHRASR